VVSTSNSDEASNDVQVDILLCAAHFIGDGMALHTFANQFFELLGGSKTVSELGQMMEEEWRLRWNELDQVCKLLCNWWPDGNLIMLLVLESP
jgi:hypothetical protein